MTKTQRRMNRTGITYAPRLAREMVNGQYVARRASIGSMAPTSAMLADAVKARKARHPAVLLDKLGERLAFERTSVRLYEAFLVHVSALEDSSLGPSTADLVRIRDAELRHLEMLRQVILHLGGDPTFLTPAADVAATESHGILQVLADPRSSRSQCLHAILVAELTDSEGWDILIPLARTLGQDALVPRFQVALDEEHDHLRLVRGWLAAQLHAEATQGLVGVDA